MVRSPNIVRWNAKYVPGAKFHRPIMDTIWEVRLDTLDPALIRSRFHKYLRRISIKEVANKLCPVCRVLFDREPLLCFRVLAGEKLVDVGVFKPHVMKAFLSPPYHIFNYQGVIPGMMPALSTTAKALCHATPNPVLKGWAFLADPFIKSTEFSRYCVREGIIGIDIHEIPYQQLEALQSFYALQKLSHGG